MKFINCFHQPVCTYVEKNKVLRTKANVLYMYSDYIDKGCVKRHVLVTIFISVMHIKNSCIFTIFIMNLFIMNRNKDYKIIFCFHFTRIREK